MAKMCRVFEVSESGYYAWRCDPKSATRQENQAIYEALKTSYNLNKGRAGLDKMLEDVQVQFPRCSRNRLYKIQKQHKLYSIRKRKFKATTNSKHDYPVAQNLLNQNFHVNEPNKVWVTDISYIARSVTSSLYHYSRLPEDGGRHFLIGYTLPNLLN